MTTHTIEIEKISTQYDYMRLQNKKSENDILGSIASIGVKMPIQGYFENEVFYLLDGHKRVRACKKLNISILTCEEIGTNLSSSLLKILVSTSEKNLHIIEQGQMIKSLIESEEMSITDVARLLNKGRSWVSVRLNMINSLSPKMLSYLLEDRISIRSFMYSIIPVTRVTGTKLTSVESFMSFIADKNLSTREIDFLTKEYFKGGVEIKKKIEEGDFSTLLKFNSKMKGANDTLNEEENKINKHALYLLNSSKFLLASMPKVKKPSSDLMATTGIIFDQLLTLLSVVKYEIKNFQGRSYD